MPEKIRTIKTPILQLLFAFLFTVSMDYYLLENDVFGTESIVNIFLFGCAYFVQRKAITIEKTEKKYAFFFSTLLSASLTIGSGLYQTNDIMALFMTAKRTAITIVMLVGFTVIFTSFFAIIFQWLKNKQCSVQPVDKQWKLFKIPHISFILWGIIFLSWIPCFLAYFPGITSYDIPAQTPEVIEGITKFHPPLHTMLWGLCLKLQSIVDIQAITIYEIVQMLILSAALASVIAFFIKKRVNNWLILLSLLFFTINPVVAIFSLEAIKDVYFAVFFTLTIIELVKMVDNPDTYYKHPINWVKMSGFILFACLFRNNAIYVFVLSTIVAFFVYRKYWKKVILSLCIPILLYFFINSVVYSAIGIKAGSSAEMLSVPIQQIANVVASNNDELSQERKDEINLFIPYAEIAQRYNPRFADPIKGTFEVEQYNNNKMQFWKLWADLLVNYPKEYVSAFLSLNLPYWYVDASPVDAYSGRAYIETGIWDAKEYVYELDSKIPTLYHSYEEVTSFETFEHIPLVSNIMSMSFPIWGILFGFFVLMSQGLKKKTFVLAPMFFLWLTYMAGPVSNFRYIFPLFLLYPVIMTTVLNTNVIWSDKDKNEDNK